MKKFLIIAVAIACSLQFVSAQTTETGVADYTPTNLRYNFFTGLGTVRLESQEMAEAADTLVKLSHRSDDIVWSRVVYRIVDLRQKQNYRLYFPDKYGTNNSVYRNLLRVLVDALCDTESQKNHPCHMYSYNKIDFHPSFTPDRIISNDALTRLFRLPDEDAQQDAEDVVDAYGDFTASFGNQENSVLEFNEDSTAIRISGNDYFEDFNRNTIKWCIQEVYYFDKHTSRLHESIIAIAPMYADIKGRQASSSKDPIDALKKSILGWVPYEQFRYYMAKQNMIPDGNSTQRVTFDDFFAQHLYASYVIGDENMFNRVLLNYVTTPDKVRKEQERISKELLDFEQDLWEN